MATDVLKQKEKNKENRGRIEETEEGDEHERRRNRRKRQLNDWKDRESNSSRTYVLPSVIYDCPRGTESSGQRAEEHTASLHKNRETARDRRPTTNHRLSPGETNVPVERSRDPVFSVGRHVPSTRNESTSCRSGQWTERYPVVFFHSRPREFHRFSVLDSTNRCSVNDRGEIWRKPAYLSLYLFICLFIYGITVSRRS